MGYTHYWKFIKEPFAVVGGEQKFRDAEAMIERKIKEAQILLVSEGKDLDHIKIVGWDGTGEPEFTKENIAFNGNEKVGENGESCYVDPKATGFVFCKTERCGYDYAVCITLLVLAYYFRGDFQFSSDGDILGNEEQEQWAVARQVMSDLMDCTKLKTVDDDDYMYYPRVEE